MQIRLKFREYFAWHTTQHKQTVTQSPPMTTTGTRRSSSVNFVQVGVSFGDMLRNAGGLFRLHIKRLHVVAGTTIWHGRIERMRDQSL